MSQSKTLKILIIGNSLVGKSSLLLRFCDNQFNEDLGTTIGVDFRFATVKINDEVVKLQIWDTAEMQMELWLFYDITNFKDTFDQIKLWFQEIKKNAPENVVNILVGNKTDLAQQRVVSYEDGQKKTKNRKGLKFNKDTPDKKSCFRMAILTDPTTGDLTDSLEYIYGELFTNYVMKNPLYEIGQEIKSQKFIYELDLYISKLPFFK
ncbi:small rab-related gtpase [Anaeramoeba ignava]|uniref:Trafficking protein particle complex subunit n=1 Tax=Anaeramoeba ignava TaxID=1746090 RepID=A0A9Q0LFI2_ANAIG|nr:small rab-related gtpase [Anaeramoeba ignava]